MKEMTEIIKEYLMYKNWDYLEKSIINCQKCKLSETRHHIVFGEGNRQAQVMIIGEAPGFDEDRLGKPFVGRAGKILDCTLYQIGLPRENVYISNIVKCRPPLNRNPDTDECLACLDYLRNQVILMKPKIIVLLGNVALKNILGAEYTITKARGKWFEKKGIKYLPTWHPAALLRDQSKTASFQADFELVAAELKKINTKLGS